MNKKQIIEYLDSYGVDTKDLTWKELQKAYWNKKKENEELITQRESYTSSVTITDISVEDPIEDPIDVSTNVAEVIIEPMVIPPGLNLQRHKLMPEIIALLKELKGKTQGSSEQIHKMMYLHNTFYNRHDSVGCSACVGNVYRRFKSLVTKFKKYYD